MSILLETSSNLSSLRARATTQLTGGASAGLARSSNSEAMAVLFRLASSHDTAGDAMALLHELQVHQVEVDMQQEELMRSRVELENELMRQTKRFQRAPAGFLVVDDKSVLCEINQVGVRLLGAASDDVLGKCLSYFLTADSSQVLGDILALARAGESAETVELELLSLNRATRNLCASASLDGTSDRFLLVIMPMSS